MRGSFHQTINDSQPHLHHESLCPIYLWKCWWCSQINRCSLSLSVHKYCTNISIYINTVCERERYDYDWLCVYTRVSYLPHRISICRVPPGPHWISTWGRRKTASGRRTRGENITMDKWTGLDMINLWLFNIAMENDPFIDDVPIKSDDFPWLC